jgi:hypothetical protein
MANKNKNNSIHQATPYSLRIWAADKDHKYWNHEKAGRGIFSYTHALSDLIDYFENVKFGRLSPNSKTMSYWSYSWGWDWRKVVRFFAHCLSQIEIMWASFFVRKWVQKAKRVTEQVKKSVYKSRGKDYEPALNMKELEEEFAIAMADATGARNKTGYLLKIKKELAAKDPETCRNFQSWLEDYMTKAKEMAEAEKIEKFDFVAALEKVATRFKIAKMRISKTIDLVMQDGRVKEYTKKELYNILVEQGAIEAA